MHQSPRTKPATAADFHRLADLAHERGLQLFRDGPRWYCSSASNPGTCYFLTGLSCSCQGFVAHQRCSHYALLLERLGWLPEVEEEASAPCLWCLGSSRQEDSVNQRFVTCPDCNGSGVRVDRRLAGQPGVEIAA